MTQDKKKNRITKKQMLKDIKEEKIHVVELSPRYFGLVKKRTLLPKKPPKNMEEVDFVFTSDDFTFTHKTINRIIIKKDAVLALESLIQLLPRTEFLVYGAGYVEDTTTTIKKRGEWNMEKKNYNEIEETIKIHQLTITRFFLLKQYITGASVNEDIMEAIGRDNNIFQQIQNNFPLDESKGEKICVMLHSHHSMGSGASGVDDDSYKEFIYSFGDGFIGMIISYRHFDKKEKGYISLKDCKFGAEQITYHKDEDKEDGYKMYKFKIDDDKIFFEDTTDLLSISEDDKWDTPNSDLSTIIKSRVITASSNIRQQTTATVPVFVGVNEQQNINKIKNKGHFSNFDLNEFVNGDFFPIDTISVEPYYTITNDLFFRYKEKNKMNTCTVETLPYYSKKRKVYEGDIKEWLKISKKVVFDFFKESEKMCQFTDALEEMLLVDIYTNEQMAREKIAQTIRHIIFYLSSCCSIYSNAKYFQQTAEIVLTSTIESKNHYVYSIPLNSLSLKHKVLTHISIEHIVLELIDIYVNRLATDDFLIHALEHIIGVVILPFALMVFGVSVYQTYGEMLIDGFMYDFTTMHRKIYIEKSKLQDVS